MSGGQFFEQFIDEYFAESEEHLATVRRCLLALEDSRGAPDPQLMVALARALHTLKGLSGMVGLAAAEQVAHAMEDGVRRIEREPDGGTAREPIVASLFTGESLLEGIIGARRTGATPPPVGGWLSEIARLATGGPDAPRATLVHARREEDHDAGAHVHRFEFSPSEDASKRGVGVEQVRQRLLAIGSIVKAMPRVVNGAVVFDFDVALRLGAEPNDEWREDGMTWEPIFAEVESEVVDEPSPSWRSTSATANVVRVDLQRLDEVVRMVGELVVTRSRLSAATTMDDVGENAELLEHQLRALREGVMRLRLVQMGEVFERLRFATRDAAREHGKEIRLRIEGQATEIDKVVVDRMLEPLLHLVRNAVSHGIESPAVRAAHGKPSEGTITLFARAAGDRILITVEDDGAGIDAEQVMRRARDVGMDVPETGAGMDLVLEVLSSPGFSTRTWADRTSGRGVGMDVVRSSIRSLGGEVFLTSELGRGTRFSIELPLTLMIADALLVEVGDQPMAIPQLALREILVLEPNAITRLENNEVISYRGGVLPLVELRRVFKRNLPPAPRRHVLVVGSDDHLTGLVVDQLIGLREIVIHPVVDPLVTVPGISGATELADGRVSLILDAGALVQRRDAPARAALAGGHAT